MKNFLNFTTGMRVVCLFVLTLHNSGHKVSIKEWVHM